MGKRLEWINIPYGGDYNPEQWPESVWEEDMELFKQASINMATVNVFGWGRLQPEEDRFDFDWLDRIMDMLHERGIRVCLGTGTTVYPSWMGRKYPELQRVDFQGRKRKYGNRAVFCPNSPVFRKFASQLVEKVAERYGNHPALDIWHISNEYNGYCYCENCEKAFREWLKRRYGTVDRVNEAWSTAFWNHLYYDWEDIVSPTETTIYWGEAKSSYPSMSLDYARFQSDSLLECCLMERDILKRVTPDIPVTTNFMGYFKEIDYYKWAQEIDIVSWDNYPQPGDSPAKSAFWHDLMRGLKQGQPFMLLEQAPDHAQWMDYNVPKRPGEMRLMSYQALARGADSVMFFQLRQSRGAGEKLHGGVIPHAGHGNTRVFREVAGLGAELLRLGDRFIGSRIPAKVAILFDWENWWAVDQCVGPTKDMNYIEQILKYYTALYNRNIPVDIIHPEADFSDYSLILAPVLYSMPDGLSDKLEHFTAEGGTFVTTYFSGYVDSNDRIEIGGYPGKLRKLLGIWVEESDILLPGNPNRMILSEKFTGSAEKEYECRLMCDVVHLEGAESWAQFGEDYYAGFPAVTRHGYGRGEAWYVATQVEESFIGAWLGYLAERAGIKPLPGATVSGVETTLRLGADGQTYLFVMNHNPAPVTFELEGSYMDLIAYNVWAGLTELPAYGVQVLVREK